jgi:hypothetical protein
MTAKNTFENDITETIKVVTHGEQKKLVIKRTQDVEPFVEASKRAMANETSWRPFAAPGDKLYRVASIPNIIVEKWRKEGFDIFDPSNEKALLKRLSSPEWKYLRMYPGRLA